MFQLTEENIAKQTSIANFAKGKRFFLRNKIDYNDITITKQETNNDITIYTAEIEDTNFTHQASLRIHKSYGILYYDCDCGDFQGFYQGMCPHLVALALTIAANKQENQEDESPIEKQKQLEVIANEQRKTEITKDKLILDSIIAKYQELERSPIRNVHLEPQINTKDNTLDLKIGVDYMYTIFDINQLLYAIINNTEFRYGQKLSFIHEISAFDEISRKLINLLLKTTTIQATPIHYLPITKYMLEEIINIYRETSIKIDNKNTYLSNESYDLSVKLHNNTLELGINSFNIIKGYTNDFIVIDKRLYNLDPINRDLYPLIDYLIEHKKLSIANTLNEFLENLYPRLYDKIDVDQEFKDNHPIVKLIIDSYIDYENGVITINPQYEAININLGNAIYDQKKKQSYFDELKALGFYQKDDTYQIDNPEAITNFLSQNLENLKSYGAVYISDSLKNVNINQIKPNVNVSYNVNMLSVCFEDFNYTNDELYEIYKAYANQKRFVILNNNTIAKIDEDFHSVYRLIKDFDLDPRNLNQKQEVPLYLAMKSEENEYIHYNSDLKKMFADLINYKNSEYEPNEQFKNILRPYQREGFKWLKSLGKYGFGGILADDMGLGKTIQIISLIDNDDSQKSSLIICPTSLTYNWKNEINKWAPSINVKIISGSASYRYNIITNMPEGKTVYITSYDSLRRDIEFYQNTFRFIIIDEAQYIKNYFTQKAQAVKSLKGELKYALTGTPIENSLLDLWSIFDFLMPNYLGTFNDFRSRYASSIEDKSLYALSKKIQPFVLRRTKKDVLKDLPDKFEIIRVAQMHPEQRKLYESFLLKTKDALLKVDNKISILAMLTKLRQLCVDPRLCTNNYVGRSSKLDLCLEIIDEAIRDNHRILVFSQFKSLFPFLEERLKEKNILFLELTGDTPNKNRLSLVESFNNNDNIKVFLISLKAGGTGLNLTGADTVIHFDPWWNLSTENQATDRAHRIGQTKIVQVNKLICEDSIEEKVIELQNIKKELSDRIISDDDSIGKLTEKDIQFLLS